MARRKLATHKHSGRPADPVMAERTRMADDHDDIMARLRRLELIRPGEPHYFCDHLRMDDPAWQPRAAR